MARGAVSAAKSHNVELVLFGKEVKVRQCLSKDLLRGNVSAMNRPQNVLRIYSSEKLDSPRMIISEIPLFRVFVASLAPFFNCL
jgi:hypothetical protein